MKKKAYLVVLALCTALAFTACGTTTDKKENTKSTAEAQDTTSTDQKDSGSEDSDSADPSDKDTKTTVSGDTRLVSVDDVSKYVTIGQYKGLSLDNTVEAVTDEWAAKNTDCKTAEDYKKEIRKTLESEAKTSAQNTLRETAWNTVLSASEVKEYPQDDLDTAKTEFRTLYENYAKQADMTLEDFVKAQGISMDDFEEQSGQYAEYKVKQNLIVQGIMDAEKMTLEDKKSLSVQDELIKAYDVKDLAALVDKYGQAAVDEAIGLLRVEDFILDNATVDEKVTAGDTEGENGDDPSTDGSSAEGEVDEELEAAEATDMVPGE